MRVEENIKLAKLYDAYGNLLSKGQQEILSSYLYDDFTVSEIAENLSISRQAVMDSVTKAEKKLYDFEEKLGLLKKIELLSEENEQLKKQIKSYREKNKNLL